MQETWSAVSDRLRHRWVQFACGSAFTLAALTAAHAAGREPAPRAAEPAPIVKVAAPVVPPAPPEPPPPLLTFADPVPGHPVNSPFGLRRLPWETHGRLHEGVDIAAPAGMPVVAAADGLITRAGRSSTYGTYVEIRHPGGLRTFYAHLGKLGDRAKAGTFVRGGTLIAKIGNSGTSTGPHLHFEIRNDKDRPLNPVVFIGKSFDTLEELPLKKAAYVSRRVHVATVSEIPASKKALMEARKAGIETAALTKAPDGRIRSRLTFEDPAKAAAAASSAADEATDASAITVVEG